jgi:hypothetical protein
MRRQLITMRTITTQKRAPKEAHPLAGGESRRQSSVVCSFAWSRMGYVAPDLQASYVQQAGRLDYTAVVKQSDGQGVWNCEHITHHDPASAIECARREVARRTGPEKDRQTS